MYLRRKVDEYLLKWKNDPNHMPLIVKGARQIANHNRSKSLAALIRNEKYHDIRHGIKLGDFNISFSENIYTFPYFCAFLLKKYLKNWE